MQPRWYEGVFLGTRFESHEHIVGMPDGRVVRAGAVQVFPEETRWNAGVLLNVEGMPWSPAGTIREVRAPEVPADLPEGEGEDPRQETRGMQILPKHLEKYGYSDKCQKCRNLQTGARTGSRKGHTPQCRARLITLIREDEEFKEAAEAADRRKGGEQEAPRSPENAEPRGGAAASSTTQRSEVEKEETQE